MIFWSPSWKRIPSRKSIAAQVVSQVILYSFSCAVAEASVAGLGVCLHRMTWLRLSSFMNWHSCWSLDSIVKEEVLVGQALFTLVMSPLEREQAPFLLKGLLHHILVTCSSRNKRKPFHCHERKAKYLLIFVSFVPACNPREVCFSDGLLTEAQTLVWMCPSEEVCVLASC